MKCPSCSNELSVDPMDATKSICYVCRKRYPSAKVSQYWEEKARIEANRTAVGEDYYRQKEQEAATRQYQPAAIPQQTRYGVPYQPQMPNAYQPQAQPQPYVQPQPAYQPQVQQQPYIAPQTQVPQPYMPQQQPYQQPYQPQQQPYMPQQVQGQPGVYMPPTQCPPQQPPYAYQVEDAISKQIKGFGIASLCTGIASLLILPFIFAICALTFGIISLVKSSSAVRKKSGMAIAGIILGGISILYWLVSLMLT